MKGSGHDTDNGVGEISDAKFLAECVGIGGEAAAPEAIADDDCIGAAKACFLEGEVAAEGGSDAPDLEETRSDKGLGEFFGQRA